MIDKPVKFEGPVDSTPGSEHSDEVIQVGAPPHSPLAARRSPLALPALSCLVREARRPRPWQRAQRTALTATGPRQMLIFDTPSNPDPSTKKKLWDPANKEYGSLASADVIMLVYDASTDELTGKKNLEGLEPLLKHIKNTKVRAGGRGSASALLRFCYSAAAAADSSAARASSPCGRRVHAAARPLIGTGREADAAGRESV